MYSYFDTVCPRSSDEALTGGVLKLAGHCYGG